MSRTIKFRVWDQKDKKYLLPEKQGFVILPTMPSFGVTLPYENRSNPGNIDEDCIDWADADLLMGMYELEQYTGLKDKNGKEIYEGDIVKARWHRAKHARLDTKGEVKFNDGWFYIHDDPDGQDRLGVPVHNCYSIEVIGNIHESNMEEL